MLTEQDLIDCGFTQKLMLGTGTWRHPEKIYYYEKGSIAINATYHWTWFLNSEQRNDIAVYNKQALTKLLEKYNN